MEARISLRSGLSMYRATVLIFALSMAPSLSSAQAVGDSTIELPAAVVEAARTGESAYSPTRLSVIGPAELDALPISYRRGCTRSSL